MQSAIGIVGLPNTGKSTLFNALTNQMVAMENFPFCTIDPSVGVVSVPDERLQKLALFSQSKRTVPATIEFVDIAGLVAGASQGEGLGNLFLSHIRNVDALMHVVRCFPDEDVVHVHGTVDPLRDIAVIETELLLADLQLAERRLERIAKEVKRGDADAVSEQAMLSSIRDALTKGIPVSSCNPNLTPYAKQLGLLTSKPSMYVCNVSAQCTDSVLKEVREHAAKTGAQVVVISANIEQELTDMPADEAELLRHELTVSGDSIAAVIQAAYQTLNLMSFFTTGEKETRAWTVPVGSGAPRAARAIHSDFEKNFIRAEVVSCETLLSHASYAAARSAGVVRLEGKEYVVQDGDVIVFRTG